MPANLFGKSSVKSPADIRSRYLLDVFLRAESMHLLGSAFALDEIQAQPAILPPPMQISPDQIPVSSSQTHQQLPYLPDWPEFMAPYCVKPIPAQDLLRGGRNIAIVGVPGSGKTFTLAYLASLIARGDPCCPIPGQTLPILFHARDLIEFPRDSKPLDQILEINYQYSPEIPQNQLSQLIAGNFKSGHVIFFLDGLDEMPHNLIQECYDIVSALFSEFPENRLMITGPLDYLGDFLSLDMTPMAMCYWNPPTLEKFTQKLADAYFKRFPPDYSEEEQEILKISTTNWIRHHTAAVHSPLEYTLQAVSLLTGLETGSTSFDILQKYIDQLVPSRATRASLEVLAYQTIISENPIINKYEIDHYVPELMQSDPDSTPLEEWNQANPVKALALVSKRAILQPTLGGNTIFTHPVFLGFLASNALIRNGQCASVFSQPEWTAKEVALKNLTHLIDTTQYLHLEELDEGAPLYPALFSVAHWLEECKQGAIFRPQVMRRLAQIIDSENQPFSIRAKAMAGIVFSGEKNITGLFKQYLKNGTRVVKVLAAYACGILQDPAVFPDLVGLLSDPDQNVRVAASSAVTRWETAQAQDLTVQILTKGDEYMRRAVTEMLALNTSEGPQTLIDGTMHEDILVRRACVFGLGLIDSPWSRDLLKKIQTEDGQWVIRNTASQALENMAALDGHAPRKLPPPHTASWLITYASRNGLGISPTASPLSLLLLVLEDGTDEEKMGAMDYLSGYTDEGVIRKLFDPIYGQQIHLSEYALLSLWKINLSGASIPSILKYGFG